MNKYKRPNFFRRNFSFSGKMERGEFWSDLGIRLIGFLCASIFLCIAVVVLLPGDMDDLIRVVNTAVPILGAFWALSIIAMTRRRLRDAGFSAKSYLWLLLPVIGWIVFVVRLCGESK